MFSTIKDLDSDDIAISEAKKSFKVENSHSELITADGSETFSLLSMSYYELYILFVDSKSASADYIKNFSALALL